MKKNGYVDLSRKSVTSVDRSEHEKIYNKSKTIQSIMAHLSSIQHIPIEELYSTIVWPLSRNEEYQHPLDAFNMIERNPEVLAELNLSPEIKDGLLKVIAHRLGSHVVKIQATVEVTCFTHEGIEAIVPSLKAGESSANGLKINLLATPLYTISTSIKLSEKEQGIKVIDKAIEVITKEIESRRGSCVVKDKPSITAA